MISKKMRNISMVCLSLVLALTLAFGLSSFSVKKASADTATLSIADFIIVNQKGESAQDWTVNSTHTSKIGTSKQSYNGITKLEWSFSALGSSNAGKFHYRVYVNDTSVFSYDYDNSNKIVANTTYSATVNNLSGNVKIEILKRDNTSPVLGDVIVTYSSDSSGDVTDPEDPETPDPEDPNPTPGEDEDDEDDETGESGTTVSTLCADVTKTVAGNTTVWAFNSTANSTSSKSISIGATDLGLIYQGSGSSNIAYTVNSGKRYLKVNSSSSVYVPVPANHKGTISITTESRSDSRYLALVVDGAMSESKRLYSKPSSDGNIASDGKTGPQSFAFTSSDLTEYNGNYYLVLKDNGTEMKVATLTLTTEKEEQEPTLEGYTYIGKVGDVDAFAKAEYLGMGFRTSAELSGVRYGFVTEIVDANGSNLEIDVISSVTYTLTIGENSTTTTFAGENLKKGYGVVTSGSDSYTGYTTNLVLTGIDASESNTNEEDKAADIKIVNAELKVDISVTINGVVITAEGITAKISEMVALTNLSDDIKAIYGYVAG